MKTRHLEPWWTGGVECKLLANYSVAAELKIGMSLMVNLHLRSVNMCLMRRDIWGLWSSY